MAAPRVDDKSKVAHDLEEATSIRTETSEKNQSSPQSTVPYDDWNGPDDPDNPVNWPLWKKVYHVGVPALQCFTVTFGSSVYTPGFREVMHHFHVSETVAIIPLSVYVLGLAFGPMLSAPLSETLGRRAVYQSIFIPSLLFTLGAGLSRNITTLIITRFLAGFFGSGCLAIGAGTNSDVFLPIHRATASAFFILAPFLGPSLGPPAGGFASQAFGWRWTQWLILMIGAVTVLYAIPTQETYKKIILARRAKRLNLSPPQSQPQAPTPTGPQKLKYLLTVTLFRPLRMLFTEPIIAFFSIYNAFNFSVLFGFFDAFPLVYQGIYHFSVGASGLAFLPIGLGCIAGTAIFIISDRVVYQRKTLARRAKGDMVPLPPEERLYGAIIGSFLLPIGLFWFAWTAREDTHWIVPMVASVFFAAGNMLVFCSAVLYLIDTYQAMAAASALAANGLLRYVCGAAFPLFTIQMYRAIGIGWATSVFGFATLLLLPIPWVLYFYGSRIRARSSYTPGKL